MVLYSLVPGSIYYPCKINRSVFRGPLINDDNDISFNSQNSQSKNSSNTYETSQLDPFFLDNSDTPSTPSASKNFSSRYSISTNNSSQISSSLPPPPTSSQPSSYMTSLTKSRLVPSIPSLKKHVIPPPSIHPMTKAQPCRRGDIIDVHVHLHSTQDEENWVTFSHQKKLPIVIKCPNWSDYIKRGYLVRPIAFLAGKEACCTIYPFHEDEEDMSEEVTEGHVEKKHGNNTQLSKSRRSASATFSIGGGDLNRNETRKKMG